MKTTRSILYAASCLCLMFLLFNVTADAQTCNYAGLINSSCTAEVTVISNTDSYGPFTVPGGTSLLVNFRTASEYLVAYEIDGCRIDVPWVPAVTCVDINCPTVCTVQRQLCITGNACVYEIQ